MKTTTVKTYQKKAVSAKKEGRIAQGVSRKFAINMPGNWMYDPKDPGSSIFQGDLVIIDPDVEVTDGEVALIRISRKYCTVRRCYSINDNEVELVADNPVIQPIIKKKKNIKVLGKVIASGRPVKKRKNKKKSEDVNEA